MQDEWRATSLPQHSTSPFGVSVTAALPLVQVSSVPHGDGETVISN